MKFKSFPNAYTIVATFILLAGLLTYIIPKGQYQRILDATTNREVVVPGSYKQVDADNLSPFKILTCIPQGIIDGGEVIVLIFLVGGCFYIIEKTGALKEGVARLTGMVHGKEKFALVIVGLLFAVGGATEGLQEEIIPMVPVLLVLTRNLGYPPKVTIGVSFGAAVIGATFSPVNPFGVVIAQKIAEVPFLTNAGFRVVVLIIAFSLWMFMMIRYGNKNRIVKNGNSESHKSGPLSHAHSIILLIVALAFVLLIYGMLSLGWSFNQISAEFFVVALLTGLIGGLGINKTFIAYAEGFKEMTFAALLVGFAFGISLILKEGLIIDTIIYSLFTPLQYVPPVISAFGMMGSQALLHLAVPSYSGQAVLTIPILSPLSELIGLSKDICVLAYQFGAISMDLISPTNGALMAITALAGISYDEWFAFVWKGLLVILFVGAMALVAANALGL